MQTKAAISRRAVLRGLAAAGAFAAMPGPALAQVTCPNACRSTIGAGDAWIKGLPIIDAHCHIFNARDIPAARFISNVFLPNYAAFLSEKGRKRLEREITAFMDEQLRKTPGYEQERAFLKARLAGDPVANIEPPSTLPEFAIGTGKSCFGRDVAENITALRNLVSIMTNFRHRIFETLTATYETEMPGVGVALYTPAMVDMDYWLGAVRDTSKVVGDVGSDAFSLPQTSIAQQIELMEMVQHLNPGRCHMFVSFCPWRQVDDEARGRWPTPLDLVKDAIFNRGFVGVKLYPPMGFLPIGNAELPVGAYPAWAAKEPYAGEFGVLLDEALRALYRFCIEHDIPVMAHCAPTNSAGTSMVAGKNESYAQRAHPFGWARLMSEPEFAGLRLNLAHFGGSSDPAAMAEWQSVIGGMMDAHPHVYADLSHYAELLIDNYSGSGQRCSVSARFLDGLREGFLGGEWGDVRAGRLIYGSDWSMLSKEFYYADYLIVLAHMYRRKIYGIGAGAERNARSFLCGNAIRFLGLRPGDATRKRLEAWYAQRELDPAVLQRFDNVDA